ncbi:hypothetical protein NGM37_60450 [Streptomyces sp. TRM76130]|nr:hypothetical protein [Streptomyces sp. TRM76130]
MGTRGSGIFESDMALDHLSSVIDRLVTDVPTSPTSPTPRPETRSRSIPTSAGRRRTVRPGVASHPRQGGCTTGPSTPEVIADGKQTFMTVRERAVDDLGPSPAREEQWRSVLNRAFGRLAAVSRTGRRRPADPPLPGRSRGHPGPARSTLVSLGGGEALEGTPIRGGDWTTLT